MSGQVGARRLKAELLARVPWEVEQCDVLAVFERPLRVCVWVHALAGNPEVRLYQAEGQDFTLASTLTLPKMAALSAAGKEVCFAQGERFQPGRLVFAALDELPSTYRMSEFAFPFADLAWGADARRVVASTAGCWPLGILWDGDSNERRNLEAEQLPYSYHEPAVSMASAQQFVAVSRGYGVAEIYDPAMPFATLTPTVFEYGSSIGVGQISTRSLSLSYDASQIMMCGCSDTSTHFLRGTVDLAEVQKPRSDSDRPYWLDPEAGPLSCDPACPEEAWLRVFPSAPRICRSHASEFEVTGYARSVDLDAGSGVLVAASTSDVTLGLVASEEAAATLSTTFTTLEEQAESVRLGCGGTLLGCASTHGLSVWRVAVPSQ